VTCRLGHSPKRIDEYVKKYVEWSHPYSSDLTPVHYMVKRGYSTTAERWLLSVFFVIRLNGLE